jgi:hypothetical protein
VASQVREKWFLDPQKVDLRIECLLVAKFGNQEWRHFKRVPENSRCVGVREWVSVCVCGRALGV